MAEKERRITDEFRDVLTQTERNLIDIRHKTFEIIQSKERVKFRNNDTPEFKKKVHDTADYISVANFSDHILYKAQPELIKNSHLIVELTEGWNIECEEELDPEAAETLIQGFEDIENLPVEIHRLNFPLLMSGYMIGHSIRVAIYSALLAQKANKEGDNEYVSPSLAILAGLFHDFGKLEPEIKKLVKFKGRYNDKQFNKIKSHSQLGYEAFKSIHQFENGEYLPFDPMYFREIAETALMHHVRPDHDPKHSYPFEITPDQVSTLTKVIAIADIFDAMTSRNYDQNPVVHAQRVKRAYEELKKHSGTQIDQVLAILFCEMKPFPVIR